MPAPEVSVDDLPGASRVRRVVDPHLRQRSVDGQFAREARGVGVEHAGADAVGLLLPAEELAGVPDAGVVDLDRLRSVWSSSGATVQKIDGRVVETVDDLDRDAGMTLMQVIALTRSLGERVSETPETWAWRDAGDSRVTLVFEHAWQYSAAMTSGFMLLGPFLAIGLYDISRQQARRETRPFSETLTVWKRNALLRTEPSGFMFGTM